MTNYPAWGVTTADVADSLAQQAQRAVALFARQLAGTGEQRAPMCVLLAVLHCAALPACKLACEERSKAREASSAAERRAVWQEGIPLAVEQGGQVEMHNRRNVGCTAPSCSPAAPTGRGALASIVEASAAVSLGLTACTAQAQAGGIGPYPPLGYDPRRGALVCCKEWCAEGTGPERVARGVVCCRCPCPCCQLVGRRVSSLCAPSASLDQLLTFSTRPHNCPPLADSAARMRRWLCWQASWPARRRCRAR